MTRFGRFVRIAIVTVALMPIGGCDRGQDLPHAWTRAGDSAATRPIIDSPNLCLDCIVLEPQVTLGGTDGPGFVADDAMALAQDSAGNYWLSQRGGFKVYDRAGVFMQEVGRAGDGPMEFGWPYPVYVDELGLVHALDSRNIRETLIRPTFEIHSDRRLPSIFQAAAALSGHRYVVNTPNAAGGGGGALPLHIMDSTALVHSFGEAVDPGAGRAGYALARRVLATDAADRIYSARTYDYRIEIWSDTGRRITGFVGPQLNPPEWEPGAFSFDNPPPSSIMAMRVDDAERLWVNSWRLKEDWADHTVERQLRNGQTAIAPEDGALTSWFTGRMEVVDLAARIIIARSNHPQLIAYFAGHGLAFENRYADDGTPSVVVWRVELR